MVICRRVKLYNADEILLKERTNKFTDCVNYWVDVIRTKESTRLRDLQGESYFTARSRFELDGVTAQLAEMFAVRMARTSKKQRAIVPYLKTNIFIIKPKILENKIGFTMGTRQFNYMDFKGDSLPEGIVKLGVIKKYKGEWFCSLIFKTKDIKQKNFKRCLGVDLGIAKTAVISDWNGNNTRFFRGEPYRFKKNHYLELRRKLQPKLKEGNIYKLLKRTREKESNWVKNENHKISREIVNMAIENKRSIALEKLTGITERLKVNRKTRKMLKGWSFSQLAKFIEYKAKLAGITVIYVDPRGTSKTCPKCQYSSRSNRRTQSVFKCRKCNYESNADRVGAINIAIRGNTGLSV